MKETPAIPKKKKIKYLFFFIGCLLLKITHFQQFVRFSLNVEYQNVTKMVKQIHFVEFLRCLIIQPLPVAAGLQY